MLGNRNELTIADADTAQERVHVGRRIVQTDRAAGGRGGHRGPRRVELPIFGQLDQFVENPDAVLATNTSSIPIMKLAMAPNRPVQVIGMHFFNPVRPLALADLIGLDTVAAVAEPLYEEFKEAHNSVPPVLARMVDAGLLGREAGRGFNDYTS